jgi:hypothetical protein
MIIYGERREKERDGSTNLENYALPHHLRSLQSYTFTVSALRVDNLNPSTGTDYFT